ncbi:MAG: EAL domain-containing protein [Methylophilaceae bacterium]
MIVNTLNPLLITFALLLSCLAGFYIAISFNRHQRNAERNSAPILDSGEATSPLDVNENVLAFVDASNKLDSNEADLVQLALTDHLTQLPNRRAMTQQLEAAIKRCERNGSSLALAFIDVDNFKVINYHYGHQVGDAALQKIAKKLVTAVRGCDKVARMGGDEFIAIIEDVEHDQDCIAIVERMVNSIRKPCHIDQAELHLSVSVGVAMYPQTGNAEALVQAADKAMYRAKKDGKNQYRFFDEEIALAAAQLLEMQFDIKNALANDQFVLHYQIKIDSITRNPVGAEAFLRWQHPTRGLLPPSEFMESAERVGLSSAIHDWVNVECCRTLQQLQHISIPFHISINLSHQQMANPNLVDQICSLLKEYDLPPTSVIFEITEDAATKNQSLFDAQLDRFKAANIKVAIDDFGTQASSIVNLQNMHVSELKLDPTFTKQITTNHKTRSVIQAIIELAHVLRLNVVAENIETEDQRQALASLGCDQMQGYLFSRPIPKERLIGLLKNLNLPLETSGKSYLENLKTVPHIQH